MPSQCVVCFLNIVFSCVQGATDETISNLPLTIVTEDHIMRLGDNSTCPICLSEMIIGDEARLLACKHIFHKQVTFFEVPLDVFSRVH
jgi:hypothetical protein